MAEQKGNNVNNQVPMPKITGDFLQWTQQQLIQYFTQLNDPAGPFYKEEELKVLPIRQLRAWAQKARQVFLALQMQTKISGLAVSIPMPVGQESEDFILARENLNAMHEMMKKQQEQKEKEGKDVNIQIENGSGNVVNGGIQQQQQQGVKRSFDNYYGDMPDDDKYVRVEAEEAAKFYNGGFAAVKQDVESMIGVQFFKIKDGNGQIFVQEKIKQVGHLLQNYNKNVVQQDMIQTMM